MTPTAAKSTKTPGAPPAAPLRLDFGSGPNKREGFLGVDRTPFPGVDLVYNLAEPIYADLPAGLEALADVVERKVMGYKKWPWSDGSVAEAHASHFVEHLTPPERCHFANELYRVLAPGARATVIVPSWKSCRAYGDPTHQWSAVSEFWPYYLNKEWRSKNAPHTDFTHLPWGFACDFDFATGFNLNPDPHVSCKSPEVQQFMAAFYTEVAFDVVMTLTKPPGPRPDPAPPGGPR